MKKSELVDILNAQRNILIMLETELMNYDVYTEYNSYVKVHLQNLWNTTENISESLDIQLMTPQEVVSNQRLMIAKHDFKEMVVDERTKLN